MNVNKTNAKVGETLDISVVAENVTSWNIIITSNENAPDCTYEESGSESSGAISISKGVTCSATKEGIAKISLSGSITTAGDEENPDGLTIELDESIDINVTAADEPKGLSTLSATNGTLSPQFDSENTGYTITLDSPETTTFKISAVAKTESDSIKVKINGTESNENDLNNITFTTSGGNEMMLIEIDVGEGDRLVAYTITVIKPTRIESPELLTLIVGGYNISLVSGEYDYTITLDDTSSYLVTATLKDSTNYMFDEFLVPPVEVSGKEFALTIVPKDPTAGLTSVTYKIKVESNVIEPITNPITTTNSGNYQGNPQTGSAPAYIVGIMLITSLIASLFLYKKNINGYN